jgi:hypothetical protein
MYEGLDGAMLPNLVYLGQKLASRERASDRGGAANRGISVSSSAIVSCISLLVLSNVPLDKPRAVHDWHIPDLCVGHVEMPDQKVLLL